MLLIDQKISMEAPGSMCGNRRRLERTVSFTYACTGRRKIKKGFGKGKYYKSTYSILCQLYGGTY